MECNLGQNEPEDGLTGPVLEIDRPSSCSDTRSVFSFCGPRFFPLWTGRLIDQQVILQIF